MGRTLLTSREIGEVRREDFNVTTSGQAVTTKIIAGTNISLSSTGADAGTGDVTINASGGSGITLKTNGSNNASQTILDLVDGTYTSITDSGGGVITVDFNNVNDMTLGLGNATLHLDNNTDLVTIGDSQGTGSNTRIQIDDANVLINVDSRTGITNIGDTAAAGNTTTIQVDDTNRITTLNSRYIKLNDLSLASASAGYVWTLINASDGEGGWQLSPSGSGDVVGPGSAIDNAIVRFDTTTGKLIQDSTASISDTGILTLTNSTKHLEISVDSSYNANYGHDYAASDNVKQHVFKYYSSGSYGTQGLKLSDTGNGFNVVLQAVSGNGLYITDAAGTGAPLQLGTWLNPADSSTFTAAYQTWTISAGDLINSNGKIQVTKTTEQMRLAYDPSNYLTTTIGSSGNATLDLIGTSPEFTFSDPVNVPDEVYGVGWNGNTEVPTKNALYDKIETLGTLSIDQVTIDFGTSGNESDTIIVSVSDTGVTSTSAIVAQVISPGSGRDLDEMEMESFSCAVGNITNGVGFDLIVTCLTGGAEGEYIVNYIK